MSFEEGSSQGAPDIRVVGQVIAGVQIVGMFELRFQVGASRYQLLHRLAAGHISVLPCTSNSGSNAEKDDLKNHG